MAFDVAFEEDGGQDFAILADEVGARVGVAFLIVDAEGVDRGTVGVGEQWERDPRRFGEVLQDFDRIVADADELGAGGLEGLEVFLQFDQLLPADWSPIGGAVEDQRNISIGQHVIQTAFCTCLIFQSETWSYVTDIDACRFVGDGRFGRLGLIG